MEKREAGDELSWFERRELDELIKRYEVAGETDSTDQQDIDEVLATLNRRVGVIPESLILIQAAKESGWGTSRFAVEGIAQPGITQARQRSRRELLHALDSLGRASPDDPGGPVPADDAHPHRRQIWSWCLYDFGNSSFAVLFASAPLLAQ